MFIHDTNQIPLLRVLLGEKQFYEYFRSTIAVPFLNSIHINIDDESGQFKLFINDKQMILKEC